MGEATPPGLTSPRTNGIALPSAGLERTTVPGRPSSSPWSDTAASLAEAREDTRRHTPPVGKQATAGLTYTDNNNRRHRPFHRKDGTDGRGLRDDMPCSTQQTVSPSTELHDEQPPWNPAAG